MPDIKEYEELLDFVVSSRSRAKIKPVLDKYIGKVVVEARKEVYLECRKLEEERLLALIKDKKKRALDRKISTSLFAVGALMLALATYLAVMA